MVPYNPHKFPIIALITMLMVPPWRDDLLKAYNLAIFKTSGSFLVDRGQWVL